MADRISSHRRSEIMSHIKSKNTSIELIIRKKLYSLGYRYRVNYKKLPGKPDIVFTKKKIAIFIHGCFWHGHEINCRQSHIPQTRQEYWLDKISRTKQRYQEHIYKLTNAGWTVVVVWECAIKNNLDQVLKKFQSILC